jgi:hypothetical protein
MKLRQNTEVWQSFVRRMNIEVSVSYSAITLLQSVMNARPHWQTRGTRLVTTCAGSLLRKSGAVYLLFM